MKITLQVHGREMTFSEEELVAILEKNFDAKGALEKDAQTTETQKQAKTEVALTPTEGKYFEVRPAEIDQRLFSEERADERQERTRKFILEAFDEMKNNSKYARSFKTLIPEKTWGKKTVGELEKIACNLGAHVADWVEQALEWAQRIANGETWEAVCNDPDTAIWYRMIKWKSGYAWLVGGSLKENDDSPASDADSSNYYSYEILRNTVPLVVRYK